MTFALVYKKSRLDMHRTLSEPEEKHRVLEEGGGLNYMQKEHYAHYRSLDRIVTDLDKEGLKYTMLTRAEFTSPDGYDKIVTVGGDGTGLDISHHILTPIPILVVNSNPATSIGYFSYCYAEGLLPALLNFDSLPKTIVHRLSIERNGKLLQTPVLNEAGFSHQIPFTSAWIVKKTPGEEEELMKYRYKFIVAAPAGSTAAISNYLGRLLPMESPFLQYVSSGNLGEIPQTASEITLRSRTRRGMIYVDGGHVTYDFDYGTTVTLRPDAPKLTLIGDFTEKRRLFADERRKRLIRLRDYIASEINQLF